MEAKEKRFEDLILHAKNKYENYGNYIYNKYLNEIEIVKKLFTPSEIDDLVKSQDLSTIQELTLQSKNVYKFTRKIHLKPRKQLASNIIDIDNFLKLYRNHKFIIERITGNVFEDSIDNIKLSIEEYITPWRIILGLGATVVFTPLSVIELYQRYKVYKNGVTLVMSGNITIKNEDAVIGVPVTNT
jgi:hypothetical protein